MTTIDANWIAKRLPKERGAKADLAQAVGLTSKQLSYILGGTRKIQQDEAIRIAAYFGEPDALTAAPDRPAGLSENDAVAFTPKADTAADRAIAVAAEQAKHPFAYRVRRDFLGIGILANDVLLTDLADNGNLGDLVVCTISDSTTGASKTAICRRADPWLIHETELLAIDTKDGSIGIQGKVVATFRGETFG